MDGGAPAPVERHLDGRRGRRRAPSAAGSGPTLPAIVAVSVLRYCASTTANPSVATCRPTTGCVGVGLPCAYAGACCTLGCVNTSDEGGMCVDAPMCAGRGVTLRRADGLLQQPLRRRQVRASAGYLRARGRIVHRRQPVLQRIVRRLALRPGRGLPRGRRDLRHRRRLLLRIVRGRRLGSRALRLARDLHRGRRPHLLAAGRRTLRRRRRLLLAPLRIDLRRHQPLRPRGRLRQHLRGVLRRRRVLLGDVRRGSRRRGAVRRALRMRVERRFLQPPAATAARATRAASATSAASIAAAPRRSWERASPTAPSARSPRSAAPGAASPSSQRHVQQLLRRGRRVLPFFHRLLHAHVAVHVRLSGGLFCEQPLRSDRRPIGRISPRGVR